MHPRAARAARIPVKAVIILGGDSANKDGIEVINVCNKDVQHELEGAEGESTPGWLVDIVSVLRLARVAKQNKSWAAQISLAGWRLLMSRRAWMMASCMAHMV